MESTDQEELYYDEALTLIESAAHEFFLVFNSFPWNQQKSFGRIPRAYRSIMSFAPTVQRSIIQAASTGRVLCLSS